MKFILIVALLGLCHVNSLPTEETLKSIEGDSDFDQVLPKGRSGKKKKRKKKIKHTANNFAVLDREMCLSKP